LSGRVEEEDMNAMNTNGIDPVFHQGDEVVLVRGSYQGTTGIFFRLKADPAWADVTERNGSIRTHPVEWLAHSKPSGGTQAGAVK
jgi:hypothetical protein